MLRYLPRLMETMIWRLTSIHIGDALTLRKMPLRICHCEHATANMPLRICHYEYTTSNMPLRICHFAYVTTNMPFRICEGQTNLAQVALVLAKQNLKFFATFKAHFNQLIHFNRPTQRLLNQTLIVMGKEPRKLSGVVI